MRSIALGLDLEEGFFDKKIDEQCHNLRLLSYPPIKTGLLQDSGQARAGSHSGMFNSSHQLRMLMAHMARRLWDTYSSFPGLGMAYVCYLKLAFSH